MGPDGVMADHSRSKGEPEKQGRGRIAIFNVKFSPNLGDGIIAECLERELRRADPALEPMSIDLAGRSGFSSRTSRYRRSLLRACDAMPDSLRRALLPRVLDLLVRFRLVPRWKAQLVDCEAALLGGGALLADADQNFPIKVSRAIQCCTQRRIPVAIHSVGVSTGWSAAGWKRVASSLVRTRLVSVSARDAQSQRAWAGLSVDEPLPPAKLAPDPGLLCSRHFAARRNGAKRSRIAICATDPLVLRLHGGGAQSEQRLTDWFGPLVRLLGERGHDVTLFTNGSPEDEQFLDRLMVRLTASQKGLPARAPRFIQPEQLIRFIAGQDCIVAHRLHACIAAYSYRIPAVGLKWDPKLEAFFATAGRGPFIVDTLAESPYKAARLVEAALAEPIDPELHARLLAGARKSIVDIAARLAPVPEAA